MNRQESWGFAMEASVSHHNPLPTNHHVHCRV